MKQFFFLSLLAFIAFSCSDDNDLQNNEAVTIAVTLPSDLPELYRNFYIENGGLNYAEVNGSKMAFTDNQVEDKPVVILLHGLPDNNFLYRDVIKTLGTEYRVIAPDHIGYGLSDRPDLEYSFTTITNYIEEFINVLNLEDVHLVITDVGGPAGLGYATRNADNVKSITMYETVWLPVDDLENSNYAPPFQEFLLNVRTPGVGEEIVINQNIMIAFLDQLTVTDMSDAVKEVYEYPWLVPESRNVLLENSRSIPVAGSPADSKGLFDANAEYLKSNNVPKLIIQANPGAISPGYYVDEALELFPNSKKIEMDEVGHFITEDKPVEFANILSTFIDENK